MKVHEEHLRKHWATIAHNTESLSAAFGDAQGSTTRRVGPGGQGHVNRKSWATLRELYQAKDDATAFEKDAVTRC